jgi:hypothetical protein
LSLEHREERTVEYVEALNEINVDVHPRPYVFLGGGITDCPDWQAEIRSLLEDVPQGTLINPRRANFVVDSESASAQIPWEFHKIWEKTDIFTAWFCRETVDPIVLFELGSALGRHRVAQEIHAHRFSFAALVVGGDADYSRRIDVEVQCALALGMEVGSTPLHTTLEEHACHIRAAVQQYLDTVQDRLDADSFALEQEEDGEDDFDPDAEIDGEEFESDLQVEEE